MHTSEFNLTSNEETLTEGNAVISRKRDTDCLISRLEGEGHVVEPIDYNPRVSSADKHIDTFP